MQKVKKASIKASVAIIMGSESDMKVMKEALTALDEFKISYHVEIVSAHRTPEEMYSFAKAADKKYKVIIAGAGGAAHLPGMVASLTNLPVLGVPVKTGKIRGLDSLVSIAQMPKGVPVACLAVDNSYNAGLLAARILAISNVSLSKKLSHYRTQLKRKINLQNKKLKSSLS